MSIKERREREKQGLRQSILSAALRIAEQEGWQAVTMRRVADRIEYRPPVLYDYFGSKEGLLQEIVREGFGRLLAQALEAYAQMDDPDERIVRLSLVYCDFAWENKELYRLMHGTAPAVCGMGDLPAALLDFVALMRRAVSSAIRVREGDARVDEAVDIHRAMLYGIVTLTLEGRLPGGRERADRLVERGTRDWLFTAQLDVRPDR